ncbi:type 1 glutamine amidotransferase family protein [Mycetocola spongiae]|uniref:peptidase S51 n=1 Tax=Mycetocola spongiae TaxID=2859226 RepID=UPI001CF11060|nr:peptidase S51 [Mycetocola spongiae]UCR90250.1 peptidase S51 [Mycetocola spongiae]
MGIYLSGGQNSAATSAELWGRFISEARTHDGEDTTVAVLAAGPEAVAAAEAIIAEAEKHGQARFIAVTCQGSFGLPDIASATALVVADGPVAALRAALAPLEGEIRRRVSGDAPYFGIGAGARVAAEKMIVGGHLIGGVPVCPAAAAAGLDEVTVEQGLGLLDLSIEIAPAAEGVLGRLVAATEGTLIEGGVGIDHDTALVIADGKLEVVGSGSLWQAIASEYGVSVSTRGA